jgi:hypothetical protein
VNAVWVNVFATSFGVLTGERVTIFMRHTAADLSFFSPFASSKLLISYPFFPSHVRFLVELGSELDNLWKVFVEDLRKIGDQHREVIGPL